MVQEYNRINVFPFDLLFTGRQFDSTGDVDMPGGRCRDDSQVLSHSLDAGACITVNKFANEA